MYIIIKRVCVCVFILQMYVNIPVIGSGIGTVGAYLRCSNNGLHVERKGLMFHVENWAR